MNSKLTGILWIVIKLAVKRGFKMGELGSRTDKGEGWPKIRTSCDSSIFQIDNGNYEELLASVKFPIWDYDYDGLITNIKLILKESGVKDKWQIPDSNLDGFLLSVRSHYQG